MFELIHGGDIYTARENFAGELLDFSANINPLGLPIGVEKALVNSICDCTNYPDPLCRELTLAIAQNENIQPESILCGSGASDIIYRVAYATHPKKAVVAAPCFAEYEQALNAAGCEVYHHILHEKDEFTLTDSILQVLTGDIDILFLCSPNNPTGAPVERELLIKILKQCDKNNIIFVLDECFNDFLDDPQTYTMKQYISGHNNLIILRAFTKMYALAGVRLGYALCQNHTLLGKMYACGSPWGVSSLAQAAGIQALKEGDFVLETKALIKKERAFLKAGLSGLGCRVYASHANYIFFSPHVKGLCKKLEESGILVRSCENYKGLQGEYCRIAVKTHSENERLLCAMEELAKCPC